MRKSLAKERRTSAAIKTYITFDDLIDFIITYQLFYYKKDYGILRMHRKKINDKNKNKILIEILISE